MAFEVVTSSKLACLFNKLTKPFLATLCFPIVRHCFPVACAEVFDGIAFPHSPRLFFQLGDGSFEGKRLVSKANFAEMHSPQMVMRIDRGTYPDTNQQSVH